MKAAVLGASGYIGGELLRLLLGHPRVELIQATSDRMAGQPLHAVHPNLRGLSNLTFTAHAEIQPCDVLFVALPHGKVMSKLPELVGLASHIIDLSADFRLSDPADYETYYGGPHPHPEWLDQFVPGIPEIYRPRLKKAEYIAVPGCMANAGILALWPLAQAGLLTSDVLISALSGSSGSGSEPGLGSHHAERSGVMRIFKPSKHRHEAEIRRECRVPIRMSVTSVEAVRGVQVTCHVTLSKPITEKELWSCYRRTYGAEPFVRIVKQRTGLYRLPEPKILSGSNYCDVGFALADDGVHLVAVAALDNLVKGGSGNAVQCLNINAGWDEREGLSFPGLHPI